jgi:hypothetical protein
MNKFLFELKILFIPCAENDFQPHFLKSKFLLYYVVALVVLSILATTFLISFPKSSFFADVTENILIDLTNQERADLGLTPLKENIKLNEVAYQKAKDMLDNDYFAHSSPSGITPWYWFKNAGYNYRAAGENLAVGFVDSKEVVDAWIDSPSHRANLLNPNFQEIGIAVVTGELNGQETTLVVQSFGSPLMATEEQVAGIKTEEEVGGIATSVPVTAMEEREVARTEPAVAAATQFITVDYFNISQKINLYSIIMIVGALILNLIIHIKQPGRADRALVLRSVLFLLILAGLTMLVGRDTILQFIPHNLQI